MTSSARKRHKILKMILEAQRCFQSHTCISPFPVYSWHAEPKRNSWLTDAADARLQKVIWAGHPKLKPGWIRVMSKSQKQEPEPWTRMRRNTFASMFRAHVWASCQIGLRKVDVRSSTFTQLDGWSGTTSDSRTRRPPSTSAMCWPPEAD